MEIRQLEMFVATAEEGSIRAGARRLMIAQPTVTQALKKLERTLGAELFERSHRGIKLTEVGQLTYDEAVETLRRLERLVIRTRAHSQTKRSFRIGLVCGAMAASELTSNIVNTFISRHPHLRVSVVEFTFSNQLDNLINSDIDVAIIRPPFPPEIVDSVSLVPVFREPRLLCFPKTHRFAECEALTIDQVLDEPTIYLKRAPQPWGEYWAMDDHRGEPGIRISDDANTVFELQMAMTQQQGVMSVSSSGWRMGMNNPQLQAAPVAGLSSTEVFVAVPHSRPVELTHSFIEVTRMISGEFISNLPGAQMIDGESAQKFGIQTA